MQRSVGLCNGQSAHFRSLSDGINLKSSGHTILSVHNTYLDAEETALARLTTRMRVGCDANSALVTKN
jgi:hypothetical protein